MKPTGEAVIAAAVGIVLLAIGTFIILVDAPPERIEVWARTRTVVRIVTHVAAADVRWETVDAEGLAGRPFRLGDETMSANALSQLVARADHWTQSGRFHLEQAFAAALADGHHLLVYRVDVRLVARGVSTTYTPVVLLTPDSTYNRPPPSGN